MSSIGDRSLSSGLNQAPACDYCQRRRIRCDKLKPHCTECSRRNILCNYGARRKRGPKPKKEKVAADSDRRIQKKQKNNCQVQALLLELEFNKKMVDIWKSVYLNEDGNFSTAKQDRPKFSEATENFIRSPDVPKIMMEEFSTTYIMVYNMPYYARNMDFAEKIWQSMIEISAADLLTMLSTFNSTLLLSVLEYYIVFLLSLKLSKYNDIAAYILQFITYIFDTVIYSRGDCPVSFEQTVQLLDSLALVGHYYKMDKNSLALTNNVYASYEVYKDAKNKGTVSPEIEAKMMCRMIAVATHEEHIKEYINTVNTLDPAQLPAIVHFMVNISVSLQSLHTKRMDLSEANSAIEKATHFARSFCKQYDVRDQGVVERYYDSWTGIVHSEIAIRSGNISLSRSKIGQSIESYAVLPNSLQRLFMSNIEYFENFITDHTLLVTDLLPLLTCQGVTMTRTLPSTTFDSTTLQQTSDSKEFNLDSNMMEFPSSVGSAEERSSFEEENTLVELVSVDQLLSFETINE